MVRALEGDADAYRLLLQDLYDVVDAYLRRMLGGAPVVEDCVQECLLALHRARHTYDTRRPFRPWLFTIVRHKAIDALRRDFHRSELAPGPSPAEVDFGASRGPEAAIDAGRLLDRLAEPYRAALLLTKIEGYTIREAAEAAGVSPTAMKSRVHRALRMLAHILEREAHGD